MKGFNCLRPPISNSISQIIYLVIFQLIWLITVIGVSFDSIWPGTVILFYVFVVHTIISPSARADLILAAIAVTSGLVIDTVLIQTGILSFEMNLPWSGIAPLWILTLWANFALILNNGLRWLQGRHKAAAMLGFFGGPLSYFFGVRLGAGELLVTPLEGFLIIGLCWSVVTPLLLYAARELARRATKPQALRGLT